MALAHRPTKKAFALVVGLFALATPVARATQTISGGVETPDGLFPATGALVLRGMVVCTGSLISDRVVLTAGHCTDRSLSGDEIPSFTLDRKVITVGPETKVLKGVKKLSHPEFNPSACGPRKLCEAHDIGLLFLESPVQGVKFARLPEAKSSLSVGDVVSIVGYGMPSEGPYGVKRNANAHLFQVGDVEMAVSPPGDPQSCAGDSGGPAYRVQQNGDLEIEGVVSRSFGGFDDCGHGTVYTRVDAHLNWLRDNLVQKDSN